MPTIDPRVDAYIRTAPAFARPVLLRLRGLVHYCGIFCGAGKSRNWKYERT